MNKFITLLLLAISLRALSQVTVTSIAVKESNIQGWADVDWQECANTSVEVFATNLQILSEDTLAIVYNSKLFAHKDGVYFTDGTIVSTGEMLRLKFIFDKGGLSQIYFLTVPKASGFYIANQMVISIDGEVHPIQLVTFRTSYWDIVMELAPNNVTEF